MDQSWNNNDLPRSSFVSSLHCIPYILPVALSNMTYDLSIRVHNRSCIGSIRSLLGPSIVHLVGPVNSVNKTFSLRKILSSNLYTCTVKHNLMTLALHYSMGLIDQLNSICCGYTFLTNTENHYLTWVN